MFISGESGEPGEPVHQCTSTVNQVNQCTSEQNVAYGCHTELARFNLSIFTRGGDCLTSGQSYKSLMSFVDPNWDTNIVHMSPMRVNGIRSPILFRFESTTGLGHI